MSENVLDRIVTRKPELASSATEAESIEDYGAFGWLRGARDRAIMLELRFKTGRIHALGNAWLEGVEFDPSQGFSLYFGKKTVRIVGRNLHREIRPNVRLLDGLLRHRVPWLLEANQDVIMTAPPGGILIERLGVE
jgi:hypothetical protein